MNTSQRQTQRQALSARQLQAIDMLQLTNAGLADLLLARAADNPLLRVSRPAMFGGAGDAGIDTDLPDHGPSLHDHVLHQIRLNLRTPRDQAIALVFAEALDANGWLDRPVAQIAAECGCPEAEAMAVLARLQGFDPAGLFARTLAECLALQAAERGELTDAMQAVLQHLPLLAERGVAAVAQATGEAADAVAACLIRIRRLNPKPGAAFGFDPDPLRDPDLIVQRDGESWRVELNRSTLPALTVSALGLGRGTPAPLRAARDEAQWLCNVLERRNRTLLAVAAQIVMRQQAFLALGPAHLVPLRQAEIATALGLNESTVSRVVKGLLMQTPQGVVAVRSLFSAAPGRDGNPEGALSSAAIRHRLRALIAAEPADAPLTDAGLANALAAQGIPLARRMAAKMRESLGIPAAADRRQPAARVRADASARSAGKAGP